MTNSFMKLLTISWLFSALAFSQWTSGVTPTDGYINGTSAPIDVASTHYVILSVQSGQRLSGVVTISHKSTDKFGRTGRDVGVPLRLLVDGVPQTGFEADTMWTLDTTKFPDGTHVLGVQVQDASYNLANSSTIVVVNNSTTALTSTQQQAVVGGREPPASSNMTNSLAWGRIDVRPSQAYPLGHPRTTHPLPMTDADRTRLANDNIWWVEGLTHQGTGLYTLYPLLVKNEQGDYFIRQWNPLCHSSSLVSLPCVAASPQFDGPRGVAMLSPYASLVAGRKVLASGYKGWLGVDISGRLMDVDISGEVTTIFGPRSVAGVVQSDPYRTTLTLNQRIAAGEKEFVGTGERLVMPQDLWPVDDDLIAVADTGANRVSHVSRSQKKIMTSYSCTGVSSVWIGLGEEWFACTGGLYKLTVESAVLQSSIADAFWIRGDEERGKIYILTKKMSLYEFDPATGMSTLRVQGGSTVFNFVFMDVDVRGNIGPKGRIYFSMVNSFASNTGINYVTPGVWTQASWQLKVQNAGNRYTSMQASNDIFGHYLWGFSIHPEEAVWVSVGIANTSWKIGTGHVGQLPELDPALTPAVWLDGKALAWQGIQDKSLGLGSIFGMLGHGGLGYSVDEFRRSSIADIRTAIDPFLPADIADSSRTNLASFLWAQRSRPHFTTAIPPPPPQPPPPPPPPPAPTVCITLSGAVTGTGCIPVVINP